MGQRVIPVAVTAEYISGDGVTLGAAGSHNSVLIEYDFRSAGPQWDDISGRYVLWTNPQGNSTNRINLGVSEKVEGYEGVYQAAPPADAMCVPGWAEMVVVGFTMDGDKEVTKIKTEPSRFRVLPGSSRAADNEGVAPTVADQLQAEIEAVNGALTNMISSEADKKVNKPVTPYDESGTAGQVLESLGNGETRWVDPTVTTDEQVERVIEQHLDWVTTVKDNSITWRKLADNAVVEGKIAADAVKTSNIQDGSVTKGKLAEEVLTQLDRTYEKQHRYKTVAHRGFPRGSNNIYARDNSQAAFSFAGEAGFGAIECDPRKDMNGHIVMLHEADVSSVSVSSGNIASLDYRDVFYKTSSGTATKIPICTIEDVLAIAKAYNMMVFFDMGKQMCTVAEIVAICEAHSFYDIGFFGLVGGDEEFLEAPDYVIKVLGGYNFNPDAETLQQYADTYGTKNYAIRTQTSTTTDAEVDLIKDLGFLIHCTAGEMKDATKHHIENMDYLMTDYPPFLERGTTSLTGSFARFYSSVNLFNGELASYFAFGLTITKDNTGQYHLSGTFHIDENRNFALRLGTVFLEAGSYVFNGVKFGGNISVMEQGQNSCQVRMYITNNDLTESYYDYGYGKAFTVKNAGIYQVYLHITKNGVQDKTLNDLILSPMVRHSSVVSDAYAPYAMTNKQITDAIAALTQRIKALEG